MKRLMITTLLLGFVIGGVLAAMPAFASNTLTTQHCPNHQGHAGKVENGNLNDVVLSLGTVFCVKGSTDATGLLISDGQTTLFEYLGNNHDVSYYVVYDEITLTPTNTPVTPTNTPVTPTPEDTPESSKTPITETPEASVTPTNTPQPTPTDGVCVAKVIGHLFHLVGRDGQEADFASFSPKPGGGYYLPNVQSQEACLGWVAVNAPFGRDIIVDCDGNVNVTLIKCEGGGCSAVYNE